MIQKENIVCSGAHEKLDILQELSHMLCFQIKYFQYAQVLSLFKHYKTNRENIQTVLTLIMYFNLKSSLTYNNKIFK